MKVIGYILRKIVFVIVLFLVLSLIDWVLGTDLVGLVMWFGAWIIYLVGVVLGFIAWCVVALFNFLAGLF